MLTYDPSPHSVLTMPAANESPGYTLCAQCPDSPGIIAAVSTCVASLGGSIREASQHLDAHSGWFFMRYDIDADSLSLSFDDLSAAFEPVASRFNMHWSLRDARQPKRVMILASREDHCLADLLYRWRSSDLPCDIVAVAANHDRLSPLVGSYDLPFHHIPIDKAGKAAGFEQMQQLFQDYQADVMVLARFMQVLPGELCRSLSGRIINIHHSFLPSFAGARPYHQAAAHGVKIIGATCHYVTEDLDAGPIIEQDVIRVHHGDTAARMARRGRDVEKLVLSRGLRYHLEDRVLIHGNRTVVFS